MKRKSRDTDGDKAQDKRPREGPNNNYITRDLFIRPPDPKLSPEGSGKLLPTVGHRAVISGPAPTRPTPVSLGDQERNLENSDNFN